MYNVQIHKCVNFEDASWNLLKDKGINGKTQIRLVRQ